MASEERQPVRGAATLFSDYASILGARFASAALSVVSVLLTTRILDPTGYGLVAYVTVIALLIFTVTSAWTSAAMSRYGREELEREGSMRGTTWSRIELTAPLLVVATGVVVLIKVAGGFPSELTWALIWLAIASGGVLVVFDHVTYSLEVAGRMKASAGQVVSQQVALLILLTVILLTGTGQSPLVVAAAGTVTAAIFAIAFGRLVFRTSFWPRKVDHELRGRILRFSVPLIAFTLSQYAIRSVDLIVVGAFASAAAVGVYAIAYQAFSVLQQLTTASGPVLLPLFVSLQTAGTEGFLGRYVERVVPQLTLIGATVAGLAVPFVPAAVPLVFGHAFEGAAEPLEILLLALVFGFVGNLLAPAIVLEERTPPIAIVNVVAMIVNIVGDLLLVGPADMPLTGPAIATAAAFAVILIGYVGIARSSITTKLSVPLATLLPFVAGFVPAITLGSAVAIPIGVAATLAVAMALVMLTKTFEVEDLDLIMRLDMPRPVKRLTVRAVELTSR